MHICIYFFWHQDVDNVETLPYDDVELDPFFEAVPRTIETFSQ